MKEEMYKAITTFFKELTVLIRLFTEKMKEEPETLNKFPRR